MNRHKIHYEVLNSRKLHESGRHWEVEVHATPEELQAFAESGYLVRESLFQGEALQRLQDALDGLEEKEWEKRDKAVAGKRGWGFIPRHLMDKDEVFLELLKFQPVLSIARAMMGPLVRLRGLSTRTAIRATTVVSRRPGTSICGWLPIRCRRGFRGLIVLTA